MDDEDFPGALPDDDSEPGVFRPRRPLAPAADPPGATPLPAPPDDTALPDGDALPEGDL